MGGEYQKPAHTVCTSVISSYVCCAGVEIYSFQSCWTASDFNLTGKGTLLAKPIEGFQMAQLLYGEMHDIVQRCKTRYCLTNSLEGPSTNLSVWSSQQRRCLNMLYEKNSNLSFEEGGIFVWISFADKPFQMERLQTAIFARPGKV